MAEISTKPYLIRAIYEWCNDNGYTPYVAVAVDDRTHVPREYVKNGEIVLNVSPMATQRLSIGNDRVDFQARFGGIARELSIPIENVTAVYARENGHGMAFDVPKAPTVAEPRADAPDDRPLAPVLSLAGGSHAPEPAAAGVSAVETPATERPATEPPATEPPPAPAGGGPGRTRKPRLTRIK